MTKEAGTRPINRLQSMYALRAYTDGIYQAGVEAEKAGRPVAWCMADAGFYGPILNAMDMESVYPENYGTLCAASGAAASFLERSDAEGFPTHLCGYSRNCLGYAARMMELGGKIPPEAPGGGMPKPVILLASGALCDARFKWFQALGRYLDVPVWTMEFPSPGGKESLMEGAHERNVNFLVREVKEFVAFLEGLLGRKMDWDKVEEGRDGTKEMNAAWYEVNQLRKARPGPMHSRDFWSSMSASLFRATDPRAVTELYRNMYDEVKDRVDNKIAGINREEKYRLIFEGIPPWHSLGFLDQLADRGWNFVTEGLYHMGRPSNLDLSMYSDPVERYVRARYQGFTRSIENTYGPEEAPGIIEAIKRGEYPPRLQYRNIRDFQIEGALINTNLSCRATTFNLFLFQNQIMEIWKVPSMVIEGDIVDTSLFDPADALRKAEAFEETMDHYKRVRKEEGLEW